MGKVRVAGFSVSVDGFGAGPKQNMEDPLGRRGAELHRWIFDTRYMPEAAGQEVDSVDKTYARRAMAGFGAHILGRNMYGPIRGPWDATEWRGWWGDNPPFHAPTFILTHHAHPPIEMFGGTTFFFVTDGIGNALAQAKAAAGDLDVKIGGGVSTVRQYLEAGLIDELHLAIIPVLLGQGEAMLAGLDMPALGYSIIEQTMGERALHLVLAKR